MGKYTQLTQEEREKFFVLKNNGLPIKIMAELMGRHRSTLYRERKRNKRDDLGYLPDSANQMAADRKAKLVPKLKKYPELKAKVVKQLVVDKFSPEVIAGRLKQEKSPLEVSAETIYQFIYSDEGKDKNLYKSLDRKRPRRGASKGRVPRDIIKDRISIHNRPVEINERKQIGDFEGDLTFVRNNKSVNIATVVERKSRFVLLTKNDTKQSCVVIKNMFNRLAKLPREALNSITFDNGTEFAKHSLLKKGLGMDVYFCDPHSPWQKGQVEKTNSLIHRYIPKNTPANLLTDELVSLAQDRLNDRPRKCLGFKTPAEVFYENLKNLIRKNESCVALRT